MWNCPACYAVGQRGAFCRNCGLDPYSPQTPGGTFIRPRRSKEAKERRMYGSTVAELNEEVAEVSKRKSQSARGASRAFQ